MSFNRITKGPLIEVRSTSLKNVSLVRTPVIKNGKRMLSLLLFSPSLVCFASAFSEGLLFVGTFPLQLSHDFCYPLLTFWFGRGLDAYRACATRPHASRAPANLPQLLFPTGPHTTVIFFALGPWSLSHSENSPGKKITPVANPV